jgi:hypothetical protein
MNKLQQWQKELNGHNNLIKSLPLWAQDEIGRGYFRLIQGQHTFDGMPEAYKALYFIYQEFENKWRN